MSITRYYHSCKTNDCTFIVVNHNKGRQLWQVVLANFLKPLCIRDKNIVDVDGDKWLVFTLQPEIHDSVTHILEASFGFERMRSDGSDMIEALDWWNKTGSKLLILKNERIVSPIDLVTIMKKHA